MDPIATQTLSQLAVSLGKLAAESTASAVSAKIRSLREEKNADAVRNAYDELVSQLLNERSEAILIAQSYKAELDKVQISDEDIKSLDITVGYVLDVLADMSSTDEDQRRSQRQLMEQFRQLINADTLRTMQLLGFNYKAAIGEPLTELCASKIKQWGQATGKNAASKQSGRRK